MKNVKHNVVSNVVTQHDAHVDAHNANVELNAQSHVDEMNRNALIDQRVKTNANYVSLKHIIESRKIKCDAKLIRRVLRKYYASKINHQYRDAWMFATNQIDDVVALIDKHCRANKSSNDAIS